MPAENTEMTPLLAATAAVRAACDALLAAARRAEEAALAQAGLAAPAPAEVERITRQVAAHYGLDPAQLRGRGRTAEVALARQVAMALCRALTPCSTSTIGRAFARDHGTVVWAVQSVRDRCDTDRRFAATYSALRRRCQAALAARRRPRPLSAP
jgi:chromosomal replication initiation ATPase DnaA